VQTSKFSFALGGACLAFIIIFGSPFVHFFTGSGPCSAEWANGSIRASSHAELLDNFMKAHRFLAQQGFHPAAQPPSAFGMQSGLITPDMITLYYSGCYQGSKPFGFRLDIDRSGNSLVPYVEPSAPTKSVFDSQEKSARAFLDYFVASMK
jgi:hypothetical protein